LPNAPNEPCICPHAPAFGIVHIITGAACRRCRAVAPFRRDPDPATFVAG
jgi:hypothetical protein